jgi:beta-glucanase (GH16 family)
MGLSIIICFQEKMSFLFVALSVFGISLPLDQTRANLDQSQSSKATDQLKYCYVLNENFESGLIDPKVWRHDIDLSGMGNGEFQYYTDSPKNSYINNQTLFLKPTLTVDEFGQSMVNGGTLDLGKKCTSNFPYGCSKISDGQTIINPITSAKLSTINSVSINRGRVEVVAKLPTGDWLWPAIWLLPRDSVYGQWPKSGEIDIMESYGNRATLNSAYGSNMVGSTLHWGPTFPLNSWNRTHEMSSLKDNIDYAKGFHTYGLLWTRDRMITYIDDPRNIIMNIPLHDFFTLGQFPNSVPNPWTNGSKAAPFDQEFYLMINLAVGGTASYFPDGYPKPWLNSGPTPALDFWKARNQWEPTWTDSEMAIKSVKMWKEC